MTLHWVGAPNLECQIVKNDVSIFHYCFITYEKLNCWRIRGSLNLQVAFNRNR